MLSFTRVLAGECKNLGLTERIMTVMFLEIFRLPTIIIRGSAGFHCIPHRRSCTICFLSTCTMDFAHRKVCGRTYDFSEDLSSSHLFGMRRGSEKDMAL
jgi:hypothetical protein